ncbi:hypothetical protein MBLNU457_5717t1 [Dothideomycetes sp. NU457]
MSQGVTTIHAQTYKIVVAVTFVVATAALSLRIYTRLCITKTFAVDDWLLILTKLLLAASCTLWLVMLDLSKDYTGPLLPLFERLSPLFVGSVVLYYLSCLTFRFSLAFFFLRLAFCPWQRYLIIGFVSTYSAITMSGLFLFIFRCGFPVTAFRIITHTSDPTSIRAARVLTYIMTTANAVCDWTFAIIPLWIIIRSRRQELCRTAVCLPIILGIMGSVVALVRFPYLEGTASGAQFFQSSACSVFLSLLETQIGIMAISLTTIRPLLAKLEGKTKHKTKSKRMWPRNKLTIDVEVANKNLHPWQNSTFTPTVDYKNIDLDTSILKGIGILPDLPSEGASDTLLGSSKTWLSSKSSVVKHASWNSISQIMYSDDAFQTPKKDTAEVTVQEVASTNQML